YIAIRPEDIVLSRGELTSSMRNSFAGNITEISDHGLYYEAGIMVGNITIKSLITKGALLDLQLAEGTQIFVSFKSTAIHTF
ncbi:MAG: TOBE domain-containing protein, partial [Thermodesulfobacteriota bacterium]|nr:TOBE domain-containing protein [Thermodesulfobacteriota bacterium]